MIVEGTGARKKLERKRIFSLTPNYPLADKGKKITEFLLGNVRPVQIAVIWQNLPRRSVSGDGSGPNLLGN